jgi:molybdate transport system substrate-binding protein
LILKKRTCVSALFVLALFCEGGVFAKGANDAAALTADEPVTILVAAAASLKNPLDGGADGGNSIAGIIGIIGIIDAFKKKESAITVEVTYASSGALKTQIENGLAADVFMSAATREMDALVGTAHVDAASVVNLLTNEIVLIKRRGAATKVTDFSDVLSAQSIVIGDPASVPAGNYAREIFTKLGSYDAVSKKASFASNVTEALSQVAQGSAEVGVVYATDAASQKQVEVIKVADASLLAQRVLYPVGIVASSAHKDAAKKFVAFLQSDEGAAIFQRWGFSSAN